MTGPGILEHDCQIRAWRKALQFGVDVDVGLPYWLGGIAEGLLIDLHENALPKHVVDLRRSVE